MQSTPTMSLLYVSYVYNLAEMEKMSGTMASSHVPSLVIALRGLPLQSKTQAEANDRKKINFFLAMDISFRRSTFLFMTPFSRPSPVESRKSRLKTWVPAYGNFVNLIRKPAILTWKTSFAGWLKKRITP